jgi:hypothetical protein
MRCYQFKAVQEVAYIYESAASIEERNQPEQ